MSGIAVAEADSAFDARFLVDAALRLYDLGLAVVPAPSDDGKSVRGAVAAFNRWRRRLPRSKTQDLFEAHPGASIAVLPHLCRPRLVVVDCDDDDALAVAEARYGPSTLVVSTPRRSGGHLYYAAPDGPVKQQNLRRARKGVPGAAIDIKAGPGAVVIVPPSIRPSTGRSYTFASGGWDELSSLPVFRPWSPPSSHTPPKLDAIRPTPVEEGARNNHLFRALLRHARGCETIGELETRAHMVNEASCVPPLPWEEVVETAASAWHYEQRGDNWAGRGRRATISDDQIGLLADEPRALTLLMKLRAAHHGVRDQFSASPKAMTAADVLRDWGACTYRRAIAVLVQRGFLRQTYRGGRGHNDPHLFSFADPFADKGIATIPNTNSTPSPYPPPSSGPGPLSAAA